MRYNVSMNEFEFELEDLAPDRLYLSVRGGISQLTLDRLSEFTAAARQKIADMHMSCGKPISCVFDITGVEQAKDQEVVSELVEFQKLNKPHIYRTALIVKKPEVKLMMTIVAELAGRDNICSFSDLDEGKAWAFGEK